MQTRLKHRYCDIYCAVIYNQIYQAPSAAGYMKNSDLLGSRKRGIPRLLKWHNDINYHKHISKQDCRSIVIHNTQSEMIRPRSLNASKLL